MSACIISRNRGDCDEEKKKENHAGESRRQKRTMDTEKTGAARPYGISDAARYADRLIQPGQDVCRDAAHDLSLIHI